MINAKHTPGPWTYRSREFDDWGVVRGGDGYIVAVASVARSSEAEKACHRRNNTDPAETNARLISAAPDLLEALEAVIGEYSDLQSDTFGMSDHDTAAIQKAISAMAKARGK